MLLKLHSLTGTSCMMQPNHVLVAQRLITREGIDLDLHQEEYFYYYFENICQWEKK